MLSRRFLLQAAGLFGGLFGQSAWGREVPLDPQVQSEPRKVLDPETGATRPAGALGHLDQEWVSFAQPLYFRSKRSFLVAGDVTQAYHEGRRLRISGRQTGLVHDAIARSAYDPASNSTLVDLALDRLLNEPLSGRLSTLSARHSSLPAVVAQLSTKPRELADRFGEFTNIRDFGARGDGTSDDSEALRTALASAMEAGKPVFLPPGRYGVRLSKSLVLDRPVQILGSTSVLVGLGTQGKQALFDGRADLRIEGMGFENLPQAFRFDRAKDIKELTFSGCSFVRCGAALSWRARGRATGLQDLSVSHCQFREVDAAIHFACDLIGSARISDNRLERVGYSGVHLGNEDEANAEKRGRYLVAGNIIRNQKGRNAKGANAIACRGRHALIIGNHIENVHSDSHRNTEGIYIKSRHSVVAHNVLINASESEAAIVIKGDDRGVFGDPPGYAVLCDGNVISYEGSAGHTGSAIVITSEDCAVTNNFIDGSVGIGIRVNALKAARDKGASNLRISGNTIRRMEAGTVKAIVLQSGGTNIMVTDNLISDLTATTGTCTGLYVKPIRGDYRNLVVSGNVISKLTARHGTSDGVLFSVGDEGAGRLLQSVIRANHFEGLGSSVAFEGDPLRSMARSDLMVLENRNLNLSGPMVRGHPRLARSVLDGATPDGASAEPRSTFTREVKIEHTALESGARQELLPALIEGRYKVRDMMLSGAGAAFTGGDRGLAVTDGQAVWTLLPPDILADPPTARWGSRALPFPQEPRHLLMPSMPRSPIFATYRGGLRDHVQGAFTIVLTYERLP